MKESTTSERVLLCDSLERKSDYFEFFGASIDSAEFLRDSK